MPTGLQSTAGDGEGVTCRSSHWSTNNFLQSDWSNLWHHWSTINTNTSKQMNPSDPAENQGIRGNCTKIKNSFIGTRNRWNKSYIRENCTLMFLFIQLINTSVYFSDLRSKRPYFESPTSNMSVVFTDLLEIEDLNTNKSISTKQTLGSSHHHQTEPFYHITLYHKLLLKADTKIWILTGNLLNSRCYQNWFVSADFIFDKIKPNRRYKQNEQKSRKENVKYKV